MLAWLQSVIIFNEKTRLLLEGFHDGKISVKVSLDLVTFNAILFLLDMIKKTIFIIVVGLLLSFEVSAQNIQYKVLWRGDSVGYIDAKKLDSLDFKVFTIKSKVGFWFFGKKIIESRYVSVYADGQLMESSTTHRRDGKLKEKTNVRWVDNQYEVVVNEKLKEPISYPITQSIAQIYFDKPSPDPLFSERYGIFLPLNFTDDFSFQIEKPDGRNNTYTFGNEYCNLVEVDNLWAKLYFVRLNDTSTDF